MWNSATSVQKQQGELTIRLGRVKGGLSGSHGPQAAFPMEEMVVPQPIPACQIVFSPVTRGVCGQGWLSLAMQQSLQSTPLRWDSSCPTFTSLPPE